MSSPEDLRLVAPQPDSHDASEGKYTVYRCAEPWQEVSITDPTTGESIIAETRGVVETRVKNGEIRDHFRLSRQAE